MLDFRMKSLVKANFMAARKQEREVDACETKTGIEMMLNNQKEEVCI